MFSSKSLESLHHTTSNTAISDLAVSEDFPLHIIIYSKTLPQVCT